VGLKHYTDPLANNLWAWRALSLPVTALYLSRYP